MNKLPPRQLVLMPIRILVQTTDQLAVRKYKSHHDEKARIIKQIASQQDLQICPIQTDLFDISMDASSFELSHRLTQINESHTQGYQFRRLGLDIHDRRKEVAELIERSDQHLESIRQIQMVIRATKMQQRGIFQSQKSKLV